MGLISSIKETKSNNKAMGLLLVFFPDHNHLSPSSPTTLFRTRPSRLLLSKAQSTISICILLLLLTLFLFTLSTFEPSSISPTVTPPRSHRRFLLTRDVKPRRYNSFALQGMGTLFLRGTKSMHDLIVAHIASDTTEQDLRLFLRLLHRSGLTSKSDVVLLFNSPSSASRFSVLIQQENNSFLKLVDFHQNDTVFGFNLKRNSNLWNRNDTVLEFNISRFMKKHSNKEITEPIWGKKTHRVKNETESTELTQLTELTHGSIVGFDVTELDPENSLSGFFNDHVPISLRRWACYPMLLGRVRHYFKHVMLVDVKTSLLVGDPFTRVRNRSPESVLFFSSTSKKKGSDINPAVLLGGAKGVRRLSSAMQTEIVRATMQKHKKKGLVSEGVVLSQLVGSVYMTEGFEVIGLNESIVEASELAESRTRNSVALKKSFMM